ncbi:MAG: hypothetical protein ABIG44_19295 [Planctomycetota bacterium]
MADDKDKSFSDWIQGQRKDDTETKRTEDIAALKKQQEVDTETKLAEEIAALKRWRSEQPPPEPPPTRLPSTAPEPPARKPIPNYKALDIYASMLQLLGMVSIGLGCLAVLFGIFGGGIHSVEAVMFGLAIALGGLALAAGGEVLQAIRDIARNSFRVSDRG